MATYISKIKAYVDGDVDFLNDVIVQDREDGKGPIIVQWNLDSPTKPTDTQLDALETKATAIDNEISLVGLRSVRNQKLAETDWIVTMHKELGTNIPAAWKTYRQALRDITDDATSLDDVTWPEKP
jgi:hypothetical protein